MKKLFLFILSLCVVLPVYGREVMKFGYEETGRPYSWKEDGQMKGILIDIVDEAIAKRMGIPVSHHGYPWVRAQYYAKRGDLDAHITNGPYRKDWAEYGDEVVIWLEHLLYAGVNNPHLDHIRQIQSLDELKSYQFVDNRGSGWAQRNLVDKGFAVRFVKDHGAIYEMLARSRADITVNMSHIARYYINHLGLKEQVVELQGVTEPLPFHLVVSKRSPFTAIIPQFDKTIRQMKADGSLDAIINTYN